MLIEPLQRDDMAPPDLAGPGAVSWHDDRGRPTALGLREGAWTWLRLEGLATYRFPSSTMGASLRCYVTPDDGAPWDLVVDQFFRTVVVFALEARGFACLHAAAVEGRAGVTLFAGPSKAGKTTLALELARRGHRLLGDDSAVIEPAPEGGDGRPALRPLPFAPLARPDTAARLGLSDGSPIAPPPGPVALGGPLPISSLVLLDRRQDQLPPVVTPVPAGEAFGAVLARAFLGQQAAALRDLRVVRDYLRIAARVPVYRLSYPGTFERLDRAAAAAETLLAR